MSRSSSISSSRQSPPHYDGDSLKENDPEIAFLLHYFSEGPGYWMDLFDLGTYFASYVPVTACENSLLRYAAVACAAKALARVQGRQPVMGGSAARQAWMDLYPETHLVDWKHKAAVFYDHAVSLLLYALKTDATVTLDNTEGEPVRGHGDLAYGDNVRPPSHPRTSSSDSSVSNTDEMLAASAILCVYEFLDTSVSEWAKHLNGAKSLLVLTRDRVVTLQIPTPTSPISLIRPKVTSTARRATFWNIARQDMLAACMFFLCSFLVVSLTNGLVINKTQTRLDPEDLSLWREAGLLIDDQGSMIPSNTNDIAYAEDGESVIRVDVICNTLVWLMAKLVNFMADGDQTLDNMEASWAGTPTRSLTGRWCNLRHQFQVWHDNLSVTFQPSVRIDPSHTPGHLSKVDDESMFPDIWYSSPMCASAMQTYHTSQVLLLMNKPHESTHGRCTVCARLNSYQSTLVACQKHSREIVGISLASSDEAVRIHSVQPIFIAGQCLSDLRERQVVLTLLRNLELDLGLATDYRMQQLTELWECEVEESLVPSTTCSHLDSKMT